MLSRELRQSLKQAQKIADEHKHAYVTLEHLLYTLCLTNDVHATLTSCRVRVEELKRQLFVMMNSHRSVEGMVQEDTVAKPNGAVQRVLQRATMLAQAEDDGHAPNVSGNDVLLSLFDEEDSHAVYLLHKQGVFRSDVVAYLAQTAGRFNANPSMADELTESEPTFHLRLRPKQLTLDRFTTDLNAQARSGKLDPLIGREKELELIMHTLCRRRKNNPLLLGDAGTGKTAIVHGLATALEAGDVPHWLAGCRVFALDLGAILAGTRYRGDFEKRVKRLIEELESKKKSILFVDEIHTLVGAGATNYNKIDASNLLKPVFTASNIRFIGATTYEEYRASFENDKALVRRFQPVPIDELNEDETLRVLEGLRTKLESFHSVTYSKAALRATVSLSTQYIKGRRQPDKALDVLDAAGATVKMQAQGQIPSKRGYAKIRDLGIKDIRATVAQMTTRPIEALSQDASIALQKLEKKLRTQLFGQDQAIHRLVSALKLTRAGLNPPTRPQGCYLLAGPTGVGKTEMCRQLAEQADIPLIRFDMSEYAEMHTLSRLIGAPPGYVGFGRGGTLTDAVNRSPHALVLFDEIEKAHPDINNLLLQVMDYGNLTDSNGRQTDFCHTIIVATTNVGAAELSRNNVGFVDQIVADDNRIAIKRVFNPEFLNRLDAIIDFAPLSFEAMIAIVQKDLNELIDTTAAKKVRLKITAKAVGWLAKHGYDRNLGARPLARLIKDKIQVPLADMMLFGSLKARGGEVCVTVHKDAICLKPSA